MICTVRIMNLGRLGASAAAYWLRLYFTGSGTGNLMVVNIRRPEHRLTFVVLSVRPLPNGIISYGHVVSRAKPVHPGAFLCTPTPRRIALHRRCTMLHRVSVVLYFCCVLHHQASKR